MTPEKSILAYVNHLIVSNFSYFCKYQMDRAIVMTRFLR